MSAEIKIIPEEIHLIRIDVLESSITDVTESSGEMFSIHVGKSVMHHLDDERIKIELHLDLSIPEKPAGGNARFVIDFHFQIENLRRFYELKEDNKPLFSGLLIATLLGLSFSTSRGIVYERLSNTHLKGIILPVVDPGKMLEAE